MACFFPFRFFQIHLWSRYRIFRCCGDFLGLDVGASTHVVVYGLGVGAPGVANMLY